MGAPLVLEPRQLATLARAAAVAEPREACGVLIGHAGGGERRVTHLSVGPNISRAADRFVLDPAHLLEQAVLAERLGREIIGIWHSHVGAPAAPGHLDRAGTPAGWLSLIVRVDGGALDEVRAWDLDGELDEEAPVHVDVEGAAAREVPTDRPHLGPPPLAGSVLPGLRLEA